MSSRVIREGIKFRLFCRRNLSKKKQFGNIPIDGALAGTLRKVVPGEAIDGFTEVNVFRREVFDFLNAGNHVLGEICFPPAGHDRVSPFVQSTPDSSQDSRKTLMNG